MSTLNWIEIIGVVVASLATIFTGMWFIVKKAVNSGVKEHRLKQIETKTQHANCASHTTDIIDIKRWIMKQDTGMIDVLSQKCSPRVLNDVGKEVLRISGANEVLEQMGAELVEQLVQRNIQTAFDTESEAYFVLLRNDKHESYKALKDFIYNQPETISININGEQKLVKLDYDAILRALSLTLRDMYLEKYPEILPEG